MQCPGLDYSNADRVELAEHETERSAEKEEAEWCFEEQTGRRIRNRWCVSFRIDTPKDGTRRSFNRRTLCEVPVHGHRILSGHLAPMTC
jgi:hypothetical protein